MVHFNMLVLLFLQCYRMDRCWGRLVTLYWYRKVLVWLVHLSRVILQFSQGYIALQQLYNRNMHKGYSSICQCYSYISAFLVVQEQKQFNAWEALLQFGDCIRVVVQQLNTQIQQIVISCYTLVQLSLLLLQKTLHCSFLGCKRKVVVQQWLDVWEGLLQFVTLCSSTADQLDAWEGCRHLLLYFDILVKSTTLWLVAW